MKPFKIIEVYIIVNELPTLLKDDIAINRERNVLCLRFVCLFVLEMVAVTHNHTVSQFELHTHHHVLCSSSVHQIHFTTKIKSKASKTVSCPFCVLSEAKGMVITMKKGRTIRKRVLLYSIEIILIAVVGTSLLVSMASYKSIHSMAIQYSDMILSHISESIEVKMKGFDRAVQNICLNTELLKYLNNISAKKNEENHMNINEFLISSMVSV